MPFYYMHDPKTNFLDVDQEFSAARYVKTASTLIKEISQRNKAYMTTSRLYIYT